MALKVFGIPSLSDIILQVFSRQENQKRFLSAFSLLIQVNTSICQAGIPMIFFLTNFGVPLNFHEIPSAFPTTKYPSGSFFLFDGLTLHAFTLVISVHELFDIIEIKKTSNKNKDNIQNMFCSWSCLVFLSISLENVK